MRHNSGIIKGMKAIIIGGGIGGMALAVALEQAGVACEVYEQADALREVGAGLVLWPNAIKALDALGLVEAVRAASVPFGDSEIRTWRGDLLTRLALPRSGEPMGALIYRTQLLALLCAAYTAGTVQLGAHCQTVTQDADGVTAHFADGRTARGDVLIGCDGIHSTVRAQVFGDTPARYAGYAVWRGTSKVETDPHTNTALLNNDPPPGVEMWGRGLRFGYRATTPGSVYWYATANRPEHAGDDDPNGRQKYLLDRFHDWYSPVLSILRGSDDAHILHSNIYNVTPLPHWSKGRVTLLGDAAQALTPNLGQGACQAIEDAVILAHLLGRVTPSPSLASRADAQIIQPTRAAQSAVQDAVAQSISASVLQTVLQTYEQKRRRRVVAIAARARHLGAVGQWEHGVMRAIRNRAVTLLPRALQQRQMAWLFRFDPDT